VTTPVLEVVEHAKAASRLLGTISSDQRTAAIRAITAAIEQARKSILEANERDLTAARAMLTAEEISPSTFERLQLTPKKMDEMIQSMLAVADLPDPLGRVLQRTELDVGLVLEKLTVPLGLLAVIFEARPDAVTQISALAMKSGNAVILKPGREVEHTAAELVRIIQASYASCGVPIDAVTLVTGRERVIELLGMPEQIDVVIPRGSQQLVEFVQSNTRIPVLGHSEGVCHIYVDAAANLPMALDIIDDAKTDYPAACNAAETVLVHERIADVFLPTMVDRMRSRNVKLHGCARTRAILGDESIATVPDNDWHHEYSDLELAVRVVCSVAEAIDHIHRYGSSHTETIVTEDSAVAENFLAQVDAAGVFHNASTRFADGYRYGFGAEVGISTSKLHARGPVGLEGLTTYKYVLRGSGQVVRSYHPPPGKRFTHKRLPTK
jgi:glutamate-5-semialdehyde dehydrogenase